MSILATLDIIMHYQILTLFPELFSTFKNEGLISRALKEGHISIEAHNLRDYAINSHGQVDDTPYGGGSGMVLTCETAEKAIAKAKEKDPKAKVVLLTPRGKVFNQKTAHELSNEEGLIFLTPRYEGVDERVVEEFVDIELCLGDFILMGGEVASMAVIEATARLLPGILGNPESIKEESFENNLLEYPQYTKPQSYKGKEVPEVLTSGNHQNISTWRKDRALKDTLERRPDLIAKDSSINCELSVALIHYPVVGKQGETITSSITNIDLHDIARSSKTFGATKLYIVHPTKTLRALVQKICEHWESGYGFTYNHNRSDALKLISIMPDFDDMLIDIEQRTGKLPKLITTSAKDCEKAIDYTRGKAILQNSEDPHLLILGTSWGLSDEILERADYQLKPIKGPTEYNHLSVRAAAAIMLDRLLGK